MPWCLAQIPFTRPVNPSFSCCECWLLMAHSLHRIALGQRVAVLPGKAHSQWLTDLGGCKPSTLPQSAAVLGYSSCPRAPHGIRLTQAPSETTFLLSFILCSIPFPHSPFPEKTPWMNCVNLSPCLRLCLKRTWPRTACSFLTLAFHSKHLPFLLSLKNHTFSSLFLSFFTSLCFT